MSLFILREGYKEAKLNKCVRPVNLDSARKYFEIIENAFLAVGLNYRAMLIDKIPVKVMFKQYREALKKHA